METLYDKLLPELKEILFVNEKKYPSVVQKVIRTLKYKDYYGDLTIEELKTICTFTNVDWQKVDWKFGEDLFGKISHQSHDDMIEMIKTMDE